MLRITTQDEPESLIFRLEGKLAGPWVQELDQCFHAAQAERRQRAVRFDLTGVTFVDAAGKQFLASRYGEGAELVAAGCLMKSIVAEITQSPVLMRRVTDVGH